MSELNSEVVLPEQVEVRKRRKLTCEERWEYNNSPKAVEYRKNHRERILLQSIWHGIISRCTKEISEKFHRYGGRGITICSRWMESFEAFATDMGPRPEGYTVEREDNDGPYSPENCRWATRQDQARNRTTNRVITAFGVTKTLTEWAETSGLHRDTIVRRLKDGFSPESAVSRPPGRRRKEGAQ